MPSSDRAIKKARKEAITASNANKLRCATCGTWIDCQRGRMKLHTHIRNTHPLVWRETYAALHDELTDWEVPLA